MARTPTQPRRSSPPGKAQRKSSVDPAAAAPKGAAPKGTSPKDTTAKASAVKSSASKASAATSSARAKRGGPFPKLRQRYHALVGRPTSAYYWIVGMAVVLTLIGRMTVLSASTAETISKGQDPYLLFVRESQFAVGGLALMFLLSCFSPAMWKKLAPYLFVLAVLLLGLVFTPLGVDSGGNLNWLNLGGLQFQPSEAAKLALAVWMGAVLANKGRLISKFWHVVLPVGVGAAIVLGLILLGHDLGTAIIVGLMVLAGLAFAGVRWWIMTGAVGAGVVVAAIFSLTSSNRTDRFASWLGDCSQAGACDQYLNGVYALASGGWFGVGLGQSRQKWNWIPEAHNDFIFAIIGEEFGLMGTLLIITLYAVLAFSIFRVINNRNDAFARIVCGIILTWIIGQAAVNIAVVVGLLPVIGVPLPLISYGGTSLIMVLAAIGVVLSFSRTEPESTPTTS